MVASKKVHCAFCRKKCTGNVLRYQDQYYHKQCFELEQQSESFVATEEAAAAAAAAATSNTVATTLPSESLEERLQQQQQQQQPADPRELRSLAARTTGQASGFRPNLSTDSTTAAADANSRRFYSSNNNNNNSEFDAPKSEQNPYRPASRDGLGAASASSKPTTRVFTSHQSASNYTSRQETYTTSNAAGASNSPARSPLMNSASRGSSGQNISANSQAGAGATTMAASNTSSRLTSGQLNRAAGSPTAARSATLPHSISSPANGFGVSSGTPTSERQQHQQQSRTLDNRHSQASAVNGNGNGNGSLRAATCAGCRERILDGQALIALDLHWHVWCFKCTQCRTPLHGEYVAKDGKAYCERDYQKLFGITCVYCRRYITGKVLQAGEAHHFHPSCARCSKCGDPFVPGEEMYLQGEVTWHPRCGPNPNQAPESSLLDADDRSQLRAARAHSPSLSSRSRSRSASPFSYMSRQYGRSSPAYADSEAVGDLSRVYTISYLNADPNQGYLRRPIEPSAAKSPQFSRPTSLSRLGGGGGGGCDRSRCSSRSQQYVYGSSSGFSGVPRDRSVPRGMYSVLSGLGRSGGSSRARSPSMMNEEAIQLAAYPSGQKPSPDSVPKIERDDFPAPPFPYPDRHHHHHQQQQQQQQQVRTHQSHSRAHSAAAGRPLGGEQNGAATNGRHVGQNGNGAGSPIHVDESIRRSQAQGQQQQQQQERASRPRSREITNLEQLERLESVSSDELDPQFRKEEEELSKIANGIGKIFLQTLKEREKLRAWKRANLDPRNASRTPSATRELPSRLRYENSTNASPSRDMDRARPWEEEETLSGGEHSPTRTRSSLGRSTAPPANTAAGAGQTTPLAAAAAQTPQSAISASYGYKVVQANRSTPRPGYGVTSGHYAPSSALNGHSEAHLSFAEQQRVAQARANDLLGRQGAQPFAAANMAHFAAGPGSTLQSEFGLAKLPNLTASGSMRSLSSAAHLRRSMPNMANLQHLHQQHDGQAPKLYPYHLLATSNYRLPPEVDRCHLERHLSGEEFQYIFHCDRLDFYRLPEWKRNELKRRARLF